MAAPTCTSCSSWPAAPCGTLHSPTSSGLLAPESDCSPACSLRRLSGTSVSLGGKPPKETEVPDNRRSEQAGLQSLSGASNPDEVGECSVPQGAAGQEEHEVHVGAAIEKVAGPDNEDY